MCLLACVSEHMPQDSSTWPSIEAKDRGWLMQGHLCLLTRLDA